MTNDSWPDNVKAIYRHDMQEIWDRRLAPHIWNQYHNQLDSYCEIAGHSPLRILDVGCAQGTLALKLAERGHDVTAVDFRPEFLEYARSRLTHGQVDFVTGNVLKDELPAGHAFANQIIEHLVHPSLLIKLHLPFAGALRNLSHVRLPERESPCL